MTYDGFARLKTRHLPEQSAGTNTTWDYYNDDTVHKVTDARGATQTFTYNSRHLPTLVEYGVPVGSGITDPGDVLVSYDSTGNRTLMTDGSGSVGYQYDALSQLTSETRSFSGLSGSFTLSYEYSLTGALKRLIDHTSKRVDYAYDAAGRLNNVTGVNYSITQFINSIVYRASNDTKQVAYGNGRNLLISYNSRLKPSHLEIPATGSYPSVMSVDYQYYDDGRVKYSQNLLDARFDRAYSFDHSSRNVSALTGAEARGEPLTGNRPYRQSSSYDAFNHLTNRISRHWGKAVPYIAADSYNNNRRVDWEYDAEGNLTNNLIRQFTYDALGQMITSSGGSITQVFDGDGHRVKTVEPSVVTYYLRSTVLGGQVIEELNSTGTKQRGFVYAGGALLAEQYENGFVGFVHTDAVGVSVRKTHSQLGNAYESVELDPQGSYAEMEDPYVEDPEYPGRDEGGPMYPGYGNITLPGDCTLDGIWVPCDMVYGSMASGSAYIGSWGTVIVTTKAGERHVFGGWTTLPSGTDVTFRGAQAQAAWLGFTIGRNVDNGSFDNGLAWAFSAVRHARNNAGPEGIGGFATFFQEPQNSMPSDRWSNCKSKYLQGQYPGGRNMPNGVNYTLAMEAAKDDINDASLIMAIWAKESGFSFNPTGDHGPMQLTAWVKGYMTRTGLTIEPRAYDTFSRPAGSANRNKPFEGSARANLITAGTFLRYEREVLKYSYEKMAYDYGPGDQGNRQNNVKVRTEYARDAMQLKRLYWDFLNCMNTGN